MSLFSYTGTRGPAYLVFDPRLKHLSLACCVMHLGRADVHLQARGASEHRAN